MVAKGWRLFARCIARWRADARGNVSLMFALSLVPLIGLAGAAIDYVTAVTVKERLEAAADAAALLAVSRAEATLPASQAQADALAFYQAKAAEAGVPASALTLTVSDSSTSGRTAVANFTYPVPTVFMKIMGFSSMTVGGAATAVLPAATYVDFYLLLDNTPSMGVAATPSDIATMVNNTSDQCAFACHDLSNSKSYYNLAKKLGVTMRIDVVRQATQQLMDTATATATVPNQFRMAIYTFGAGCDARGLTTISSLTSNLANAKTAASAIDLMTVPYQNYYNDQCTDFDGTLQAANAAIPAPGTGTLVAPQKFLFLVSDGVADAYYPTTCTRSTTGGRCQEPLTVANCTALKSRGVQIAVLYTTYLALPTNSWYNTWIDPFNKGPYNPSTNSQIAQNMQSCASPGFYFEVSPTQGIADAMTALFQKAVAHARLSR